MILGAIVGVVDMRCPQASVFVVGLFGRILHESTLELVRHASPSRCSRRKAGSKSKKEGVKPNQQKANPPPSYLLTATLENIQ